MFALLVVQPAEEFDVAELIVVAVAAVAAVVAVAAAVFKLKVIKYFSFLFVDVLHGWKRYISILYIQRFNLINCSLGSMRCLYVSIGRKLKQSIALVVAIMHHRKATALEHPPVASSVRSHNIMHYRRNRTYAVRNAQCVIKGIVQMIVTTIQPISALPTDKKLCNA